MLSTLLVLVTVILAGWAVAYSLRPPRPPRDPQQSWEHWLEASGLRPVIPRMAPVCEATAAAGRDPREVDRAAMGRTRDGCPLVVAQLVGGEVLVGARRSGPVPSDRATDVRDGWQLTVAAGPVERVWEAADWVRNGPPVLR